MVMAAALIGESGAEGGDAGDVHTLLGLGEGAAEDYVVHFFHVKLGNAAERAAHGDGSKIIGPGGAQGTARGLAHGGANGADDDGFSLITTP